MNTAVLYNFKNNPIFSDFIEYLIVEKNLTENSIAAYSQDLKKFFYYLSTEKKDIFNIHTNDIIKFLKSKEIEKNSKRSIARIISTLRQFYNFLLIKNYVKVNPLDKIEQPRIEKNIPDYLTVQEINHFFSVFNLSNIYEIRDRCIFEIMYVSGLRISEVCNLKLNDIDFNELEIIVTGKGNKQRIVPFGEKTLEILKQYLKQSRPYISKNRRNLEFLFISKKGSKLDRKSVWKLLQKYAKRAEIIKPISPHTFRHSFATHMIQNHADLRLVQELLGHMDISTTQIYTHVDKKHLKEAHRKFHPRG